MPRDSGEVQTDRGEVLRDSGEVQRDSGEVQASGGAGAVPAGADEGGQDVAGFAAIIGPFCNGGIPSSDFPIAIGFPEAVILPPNLSFIYLV